MAGVEEDVRVSIAAWERFLWVSKKLASPILKPFSTSSNPPSVDEDTLNELKFRLDRIRASIKDAESRYLVDESVKLWLRELRDMEYNAQDILEEFEIYSHRDTMLHDDHLSPRKRSRKVQNSLPTNSSLARKIDKINKRFANTASDRKALKLRKGDGEVRPVGPLQHPTTSFRDGEIYGREGEMNDLVMVLKSGPSQIEPPFSVIPIIGMAGVGKTTLVQHAYQEVLSEFELKAWVSVSQELTRASQEFELVRLTQAIIQGFTRENCLITELNVLQEVMIEKLKGKKFLIVLDDVWCEDWLFWERLQAPLNVGARGSKVIITTRSVRVAQAMGEVSPPPLGMLSDDHCWLICEHILRRSNPINLRYLMQIGRENIPICKGLPLAAKELGFCLFHVINKDEVQYWVQDKVLPVLRLSYDHLPMSQKRCFAYCSLFPKGFVFERDELVRLWMAQEFIEPEGESHLEDIGQRYFDELVGRTFFQYSQGRYEMHDLFHDLAESISGDECSRKEDDKLLEVNEKARHSSLVPQESHFEKDIQLESFDGQDLRTFLFIGRLEYKGNKTPFLVKIPNNLFIILECLRTLDLSNTNIRELPNSIDNLKHLRYLSLKNTKIERLPESVCSLLYLQTLDLDCCSSLKELPLGTRYLSKLRHLLTHYSEISMPTGIGGLTDLHTLPMFIVGSSSEAAHSGLGELRDLVHLRGMLHITGLTNVINLQEAELANLKNKENIQKLILEGFSHLDDKLACGILEMLQPHPNLEELVIRDYHGIRFAKWLGNPKFTKLVTVSMEKCGKCTKLPPLGQLPSLRHLTIQSMAGVQSVGREFCGSESGTKGFPMLETLEFKEMYEWAKWGEVEDGDFPRLRNLTIRGCTKLKNLPSINSLEILEIHSCEDLLELPPLSSLQSLKMEGYRNLKHLPRLPNLTTLEMLEVVSCNQLASIGNLQHLASLRKLILINCLKLCIARDEQLPLNVQVDIRNGYLAAHQESRILINYDKHVET